MNFFKELIQLIIGAICYYISCIFIVIIVLNNIDDVFEKVNETANEPLTIGIVISICIFSAIISMIITNSFLKIFKNN
jgi:hypothetical protein